MEAIAVAKYQRISPYKLRRYVNLVRGKGVDSALQILQFTPRRASRFLEKVIKSAVANAINLEGSSKLQVEDLFIKKAVVDEGPTMKRFRPQTMGRVVRIRRRTSHITVVVSDTKD